MNQPEVLDHVAKLLLDESSKGSGTLILLYDTDYRIVRFDAPLGENTAILGVFDTEKLKKGLPPSEWLGLSKKLWAVVSSKGKTIKLPHRPNPTGPAPKKHDA